MSEVEKLYSLAGVEKKEYGYCDWDSNCPYPHHKCNNECPFWKIDKTDYPPFTAEKQIALFTMFCRRYLEVSQHVEENGDLCFGIKATVGDYAVGFNKDFAECLADFVNCLWQDLTEAEQNEIREILK